MELVEALRTTGAVRKFDAREVPDRIVYRLLDAARFAPNGGNRQAWRVVVIKDPGGRRAVRDAYLPAWYEYRAQMAAGLTPWSATNDREVEQRALENAAEIASKAGSGIDDFAEHFDEVPLMMVLLADLGSLASVDRDAKRYTMVGGASIYPFAWSILLAAREEGLAGVITTMAVRNEPAVKTALRVPDGVVVAGVLALGYPVRLHTRLRRDPVESFATIDRYDGTSLEPG